MTLRKVSAKRLSANAGKIPFCKRSAIRKTNKPIPKVNPKAKAKRKIAYRKMLASPEYKAARAEAMERAGNRCEFISETYDTFGGRITRAYQSRCFETGALHAHHLRYPKTRPLAARDLQILCLWHHDRAEAAKMHKTRMF